MTAKERDTQTVRSNLGTENEIVLDYKKNIKKKVLSSSLSAHEIIG